MRQLILGTAGHIDHGKTTIVKALTGTDTDRLPEEKARGITIDLGFAHLRLAGLDVGIVDVPGHEALIRNMLAGATGFDAVLLVIAADEGIMPQTREHVAIARLLGVQRMIVALSKVDLVEADWLDLVRADVEAWVAREFGEATVCPVSATTGAGLPELQAALHAELSRAAERAHDDLFRMPIDRVFTVHGTGTVVTGTVWSGRVTRQESLRVLPADRTVRVRAMQTHGRSVETAAAGERAALALAGVDREQLRRGDVLTAGGCIPTDSVTARVDMLPQHALRQRQRVRIHLGTASALARVVILADGWVQFRLEAAISARAGDRFVIRTYSPVATVGGGRVAEMGRARKSLDEHQRALLAQVLDGDVAARMHAVIVLAGERGSLLEDLPVTAAAAPADVGAFATSPPDDVARFGDRCYARSVLDAAVERLRSTVGAHHEQHPLEAGIERAVLVSDQPLMGHALEAAVARGLLVTRGSVVLQAGFSPSFPPAQHRLREQLRERLRQDGLMPPGVSELTTLHRSNDVRAVLRLMEAQGEVTAINADLYVAHEALEEALAALRATLGGEPLPAGDFRAALPVSRKYLIPLLEYLDRVGVTKRDGDLRRVLPREQAETA